MISGLSALAVLAHAAPEAPIKPGTHVTSLEVGSKVYENIEIRSVNARTVTFLHRGGLTSVHLKDLSPEWQARFHFDPAAAAAADRALLAQREIQQHKAAASPHLTTKQEALLRSFGRPPTLAAEVDLRPRFFELELNVKNQGRRPSCAVFAIVCALEFQNAELTGRPEQFSEEYLVWATYRIAHRIRPAVTEESAAEGDADAGFTLGDVVTALRAYGIPPQTSLPNALGGALAAVSAPPESVITEARAHRRVFVHALPGPDNATRVANIVHALNAGVPVVVGLPWPSYRSLRGGYLNTQTPLPGLGHAVTIVGYRSTGETVDSAVFLFKNSWGVKWGQGGYGLVTFRYLEQYLGDAVVLEVQAPTTRG